MEVKKLMHNISLNMIHMCLVFGTDPAWVDSESTRTSPSQVDLNFWPNLLHKSTWYESTRSKFSSLKPSRLEKNRVGSNHYMCQVFLTLRVFLFHGKNKWSQTFHESWLRIWKWEQRFPYRYRSNTLDVGRTRERSDRRLWDLRRRFESALGVAFALALRARDAHTHTSEGATSFFLQSVLARITGKRIPGVCLPVLTQNKLSVGRKNISTFTRTFFPPLTKGAGRVPLMWRQTRRKYRAEEVKWSFLSVVC